MAIKPMIEGKLYVNLDFDGTITTEQDDNFGKYELRPFCKEAIELLHRTGKVHFGIWSCRSEPQMKTAKVFLKETGLYDYMEHFNGDFPEVEDLWKNPTRKSSADIYIDDRAMWGEINWYEIYLKIMALVVDL